MSSQSAKSASDYLVPRSGSWANAWKIALTLAIIGVALSAFGWTSDARRFAFSWLFAFMTFVTLGLGAIFFVIIQHLTAAHWSVTVRRTAEFFAAGFPVFLLLFLPLMGNLDQLYEWAGHGEHEESEHHAGGEPIFGLPSAQAQPNPGGAHEALGHAPHEGHDAHEGTPSAPGGTAGHPGGPAIVGQDAAAGHGEAGAHAHSPQHHLHAELMHHKAGWLNPGYWRVRAIAYLAIWILLALFFFQLSTRQDETKDARLTVRMQRFAPAATFLFGLSLTFAVFDWVMALEPTWYSTIYGVYLFAGCAVSIHALVTVVTLSLRAHGLVGDAIGVEHFHDLGKMTFGFVVFWAYVGFSQMMLIWYANIPEETVYYYYRWHGEGWRGVSLMLILGHFCLPFFFLLSRNVKRRLPLLGFGSAWLLVMHAVDIYWFVMPIYEPGRLTMHWLDLAALMAVGGVYFTVVLFGMRRYALIPVGDPRLSRCLSHVNV